MSNIKIHDAKDHFETVLREFEQLLNSHGVELKDDGIPYADEFANDDFDWYGDVAILKTPRIVLNSEEYSIK